MGTQKVSVPITYYVTQHFTQGNHSKEMDRHARDEYYINKGWGRKEVICKIHPGSVFRKEARKFTCSTSEVSVVPLLFSARTESLPGQGVDPQEVGGGSASYR